jgi:GH43 family beta-xylosidase
MALSYKGKYLFIATDDEHNQLALKIRIANSLKDIPSAPDHVIFQANTEGDLSGCIWAPEIHVIKDKLCIFFAAGKPHWYTVQSHVIMLEGDDLLNPACWSAPRKIVRTDGTPLAPEGSITLDMTVVKSGDTLYVVWSERPIKMNPVVCGTADLLIARLDTENPWKLASEPVVLSRPEYGWERINSAVNEGPFALYRDSRIFVTYSAALIDATYCMGMLEAIDGSDLCDPASWTKTNYPVLHRLSTPGQIGSGHCAFVKDKSGRDIMLFHALDMRNYIHDPSDCRRYPGFRPVLWDNAGFPHFDSIE